MPKKMLIDATHAEETRVVVVDGNKVEEFDFESEARRQLAGNIYLAKVTRVEPSLQAAFVDYGGNRHGFLAFSEIHPDYYQIPVADREALLAEEAAMAADEEEEEKPRRRSRSRSRTRSKAAASNGDSVVTAEPGETEDGRDIPGMAVVEPEGDDAPGEATEAGAVPAEVTVIDPPQDAAGDETPAAKPEAHGDEQSGEEDDDQPYSAVDDAAERDEDIESVADEDVTDEIRRPRKSKLRKYKIQEVIKVRQILLVQVVKEERGNKGAALTTYLSLAGRYCVLMPNTARGGGISRKITNAADRKKLKEIATSIDVPKGAGLIIRTAGAQRTKTEIKRDYEYLQRMWEQIRELTLKSIAPAKIYEEGDLIKRSIRDLYNREIDEVWVEGAEGYRVAKDFMKMIMPSHAKNVKHYQDQLPLFARYQVESYLGSMFNPTVQLKSGGYIVIGVTEALVAIDVNSGKATKEGSIEETALKTNLEAAEEVARQLRLRDLAGLIVIDFIDMEERKNNAAVEKRFKEKLKTDRARIQVGRISGFGLLEMSRQRLRPGMIEATTQPCPACHGTGLIRSVDNLALGILRALEEEGVRKRTREVLVKVPVEVCNFLMNHKREHIAQIEARYGLSVRIEADAHLIAPDYTIEKFKTQTRVVEQTAPVVSANAAMMAAPEEDETPEVEAEAEAEAEAPEAAEEAPQPKKKRRRRRRRKSGGNGENGENGEAHSEAQAEQQGEAAEADAPAEEGRDEAEGDEGGKPKRRRSRGGRRRKSGAAGDEGETGLPEEADSTMTITEATTEPPGAEEPVAVDVALSETPGEADAELPVTDDPPLAEPLPEEEAVSITDSPDPAPGIEEPAAAPDGGTEAEAAPVVLAEAPETDQADAAAEADTPPRGEAPAAEPVAGLDDERVPEMAGNSDESEAPPKPKKRGWWSIGR
jgi:ribonuclease E